MADILDIERLDKLKSIGGPELLFQMLDLYLGNAPDRISGILEGCREQDYDRIRKSAHSLKSSSGNVGAMAFMDLCQQIEVAAEQGNLPLLEDLQDSFVRQSQAVLAAVRAVREESDG